jgi:hypothetical protein
MAGFQVPQPLCSSNAGPMDTGTAALTHMPAPGGAGAGGGVAKLGATERIAEAIRRAVLLLPVEVGGQLGALLTPGALATMAAILGLWAGSHAFGVGEVIDILLLATGAIFIGREALEAMEHLVSFARLALNGSSSAELDQAAGHLAKAVSIIGVGTIIVLLTRGTARAYRGRYKPTIKGDPHAPAGSGGTNKYGDITYSTAGTATDRALVLHHEKVHAALSPKLMLFREMRADLGIKGYSKSSFLRYLEEAMAESYAQLRVNGIKGLPAGIRFPVANGYVSLRAVLTEAAIGAAAATITVGGIVYAVEFLQNEH